MNAIFILLGLLHLTISIFYNLFSATDLFSAHLFSLVFLLFYFRSDKYVLPLLIFASTYTLYLIPYFYFNLPYHYLVQTQTPELTIRALAYQFTFYYLFFSFRASSRTHVYNFPQLKLSKVAFFALTAFLLLMLLINIGISPPRLGVAYDGSNNSTVWIEYSFIFLVLLCCSTLSQKYRYLVFFVILCYMIYPLLYSRRLQFIMVLLLFYYRFYVSRLRVSSIFLGIITAFVGLRIFESLRMGVSPSLLSFFITTNSNGVTGSNQGGVMVSNTIYLHLIDIGIFDWSFRLKSFLGNLVTGLLPGSFNFSETYVNLRALENMPLPGNGGFTAVYSFLWMGEMGVIFISILLGYLAFTKNSYWVLRAFPLAIFMTFPRLHSYNFLATIKVMTILLIVYLILKTVRSRMANNVNKN